MITTCQIAFVLKGQVIALEKFDINMVQPYHKAQSVALQGNSNNPEVQMVYKKNDGSRVVIESDSDVIQVISDSAMNGSYAEIKLKPKKKQVTDEIKSIELDSAGTDADLMGMPACVFVDEQFVASLSTVLESSAIDEVLAALLLKRTSAEEIICILGLQEQLTFSPKLAESFNNWIALVSEEQLQNVIDQIPRIVAKLVNHKRKLHKDIFAKQKSIAKILKIKKTRKFVNGDDSKQTEEAVTELKKAERLAKKLEKNGCQTVEELDALKKDKRLYKVAKRGCKTDEELKALKNERHAKKLEKYETKKELKALKLAKKLEKHGCQTEEELKALKYAKKLEKYGCQTKEELKAFKVAKKLDKYGCKTVDELNALKLSKLAYKVAKSGCKTDEELKAVKDDRLAKKLERYGCQTKEDLKTLKLAKKLEKFGCQTEEELKALQQERLRKKLEKFGCHTKEELKTLRLAKKLEKYGCRTIDELYELKAKKYKQSNI